MHIKATFCKEYKVYSQRIKLEDNKLTIDEITNYVRQYLQNEQGDIYLIDLKIRVIL